MSGSQSLFLTCSLVLFCFCSSSVASDDLTRYLSFTVPGITGGIQQADFEDVDGDDFPEVLVSDGQSVVLYSIERSEVLFSAAVDTSYEIHKILLADVNRDLAPDIMIAHWYRDDYPSTMDDRCRILLYDGGTRYVTTSDTVLDFGVGCWGDPFRGGVLEAADLNEDGYNELVFSLHDVDGCAGTIGLESTSGASKVFHSYPDSAEAGNSRFVGSLGSNAISSDPSVFLGTKQDWYRICGTGQVTEYGWEQLVRIDASGEIVPLIIEEAAVSPAALENAGDLGLVLWQEQYRHTWLDHGSGIIDSSNTLHLISLASPDSGVELWSLDVGFPAFENFLFHPDYPNGFLAIKDDILYWISLADGHGLFPIADVPDGIRFWDRPFADDEDYLVVLDESRISLLTIDAITDVEENPSAPGLPGTFVLGQPYPNPFNATLSIPISQTRGEPVKVEVLNLLGQVVEVLHDDVLPASETIVTWEADRFASGVYMIRSTSGDETKTAKAVLLK